MSFTAFFTAAFFFDFFDGGAEDEATLAGNRRAYDRWRLAPRVLVNVAQARCAAPLALEWYGQARQAVQVRCPTPGGWTLYVPLTGPAPAAEPPVIRRGDAVTITVGGEGFAVSQAGEALEPGAAGSWIKVRGLGPKAPVLRGQVLRPGLVGLALP